MGRANGGPQRRSAGFHEKFIPARKNSLWPTKPCCKRFAAISTTRCIDWARMYQPGFAVYIALGLLDYIFEINLSMNIFIKIFCCLAFACNCYAEVKYISPKFPDPTLEGARNSVEEKTEAKPTEKATAIVDSYWVSMSIASDLVNQHHSCFLQSEAKKMKRVTLLDHELSVVQRNAADTILSPVYRQELTKSNHFEAIKRSIAQKISFSSKENIDMAYKLLGDEAGVDFALAWIAPILRGTIDKSCGSIPYESTPDDWRQQALWATQSKAHKLD